MNKKHIAISFLLMISIRAAIPGIALTLSPFAMATPNSAFLVYV